MARSTFPRRLADHDDPKMFPIIKPAIDANIKTYGQAVIACARTKEVPEAVPYMYTIGLRARGQPELIFVGEASPDMGGLINKICESLKLHIRFHDNMRVGIGTRHPFKLLTVGMKAKSQMQHCAAYWKTLDFDVMQIIMCDKEGRWPGDPDCSEPFASTVVLKDN